MSSKLRSGATLDGWQLQDVLGRGGNAQVWRATHPEVGEAALKVLTAKGGQRWQRFGDEISIMTLLKGRDGVLPLLASCAPELDSGRRAWLATPISEGVVAALGGLPTLGDAVECVRTFATSLAALASEGVHHRDIKPSNLFRYDGNWVLGDFGLADFPEKEPVTGNARRLGPLFFIAPEMLRRPADADGGPADVYSLAKTLWVLATGESFPPDGQIRADDAAHDLSRLLTAPGSLALTLILQRATATDPASRPSMVELEDELRIWMVEGPRADERAAVALSDQYIRSLGETIAGSLDASAFSGVETNFVRVLTDARRRSSQKQVEASRAARQEAEMRRREWIEGSGAEGVLRLHDTVWIGSQMAGREFADAVLHQPPGERQAQLYRARQVLWGRPLWWAHTVALAGSLRLRGQEGCEPLATEIANQWARYHLLEFSDHPTLAAAWRLQRTLAPAVVRLVARAPLEEVASAIRERLSAQDRVAYSIDPARLMMIRVDEIVRQRLREVDWQPDALLAEATAAQRILDATPVPAPAWDGPIADPWLESWSQYSPLLKCGIAVLNAQPLGDDLVAADELRTAIDSAADSEFEVLGRVARPLLSRLR